MKTQCTVLQPDSPFLGEFQELIAETLEMLDFCAELGIVSDIEMIGIQ